MATVFLDANVPMYLIGASHPLKVEAAALVERLAVEGHLMVTDAEVFQEILHRYIAIQRYEAIQPAFDALHALVEEIFPIDIDTVSATRSIALGYPGISARDAIHVASMNQHGVTTILSFNGGYDRIPGLRRIFHI